MKAHTVFAFLHSQPPLSPFLHRRHGRASHMYMYMYMYMLTCCSVHEPRASHMCHRPGHQWTVTHEPFTHVCACCVPLMVSDFAVVDFFYLV